MIAIRALKVTEQFAPITVGIHKLSFKIVHAPASWFRELGSHVVSNLTANYYDERSKYPGTFLISDATIASPKFGMKERVSGILH